VGKTTTTANLGAALAARGASVVLIDADVGLRNLDVVMGLEARVRHNVLDVLEETVTLDEALVRDKRSDKLHLLAAAQTREKDEVDRDKMVALVNRLRERFDYVIIDCPAGIESGFKNAVAGAQEAIVVCTPEVSSVRDADRVVGLLPSDFRPVLIINRLRPALVRKGTMLSVEDVDAILRLPLLGVIADEPQVIVATNRGEPPAFDQASSLGAAYRQMAAKLAGDDVDAPTVNTEAPSLFGRLFGGRK
jgi:septum site-determining protein MinD